MIIYGLGLDLVNINRLKTIIKKNKNFQKKIFSKSEISFCKKKFYCFAKRFAAKEAFSKSLGTGIAKGLNFKEIETKNDYNGRPYIKIKGKSLKTVHKIIKKKKFKVFLSLSDEKSFAIAIVILTI